MTAPLDRLEWHLAAIVRDQLPRPLALFHRQAHGAKVRAKSVLRVEDDHRILARPRGAVRDVPQRIVDERLSNLLAAVEARADVVVDRIDGAAGDGIVGCVLEEEAPGVPEQSAR